MDGSCTCCGCPARSCASPAFPRAKSRNGCRHRSLLAKGPQPDAPRAPIQRPDLPQSARDRSQLPPEDGRRVAVHFSEEPTDIPRRFDPLVKMESKVAIPPVQGPLLPGFREVKPGDWEPSPFRTDVRSPRRVALKNCDGDRLHRTRPGVGLSGDPGPGPDTTARRERRRHSEAPHRLAWPRACGGSSWLSPAAGAHATVPTCVADRRCWALYCGRSTVG
jgi:hypothetical protein